MNSILKAVRALKKRGFPGLKASFVMLGRRDVLTGGYVFNFRMAEYMSRDGIETDVISRESVPEGTRDSVAGTSVYVASRVLRSMPDVLVVSKSYLYMLPLRIRLIFRRIPLLYLVHHLEWRDRGEERGSPLRRSYVKWLLNRADTVWTNSRCTSDDLSALGIRRDRIRVIPPGFHRPDCGPADRGSRVGPVRLLSVGSLVSRKAQDVLVRACAALKGRDFVLDLVGDDGADPGYTALVEELVRESSLEDRVRLRGTVGQDELVSCYREADILVHPSTWEGYGIVVAEGMWHGLPVVASGAGAVPELVADGVSGFLVKPGDAGALAAALEKLMLSRELRLAMGMESRRLATEFIDWDTSGSRFCDLVRETASKKGLRV